MRGTRRFEQLSWHWKLPLLVAGLAVMAVTTFGIVSYRQVRASALHATRTRLRSALGEINAILGLGIVNQLETLNRISTDAALGRALTQAGAVDAAAIAVLATLSGRTGMVPSIELRDAAGQVRHRIGSTLRDPGTDIARSVRTPSDSDKATIGPLFLQDTSLYFWSAAPVRVAGKRVGDVRVARRVGGAANTRIVTRLLGNTAALLVGNDGGPFWNGKTEVALTVRDTSLPDAPLQQYARGDSAWVAMSMTFLETPWRYVIEMPESEAIAPARALVWSFVWSGFVIAALTGLVGLLVSRSITSPLRELTDAAEHIARGDPSAPLLASDRHDEIGRLARAFAVMTEQLRGVVSRLEADVDARGGELKAAVGRLQRLDESLQQNVRLASLGRAYASVGHELRNPLGVMSNVVVLLDTLPDASPKIAGYAHLLREQIRLSERIVTDLLDRARAGSRGEGVVDLALLIDETLARVTLPQSVRVTRQIDPLVPPIVADRDQVGQILWNLITNAVQAIGAADGEVAVLLRAVDTRVHIEIRDTGPGVAAGDADRLFEPLFTRKADGVGLGLAISRDFARANGGDLTIESSVRGACFRLELPLRTAVRTDATLPSRLHVSETTSSLPVS